MLCVGVDLAPALRAQNVDADETIDAIETSCNASGGSGPIPSEAKRQLESVSRILNIGWIADGAEKDATIICQRSSACPRDKHCLGRKDPALGEQIEEIRGSL